MHRFGRSLVVVCVLAGCGDDTAMTPTSEPATSSPFETSVATSTGDPEPTGESTVDPATSSTPDTTTTSTTTTSTTVDDTTATTPPDPGTTTTGEPSTGETGDTSTTDDTDGCTPGHLGCVCDADNECVAEATCWAGLCEKNGGNLCPYEFDGNCDEGNGICPPGSDPHDCCAAQGNGVCEEIGMGGDCPIGTDVFDCGGCEWVNDGYCDEPNLCPPGSDKPDCCATPEDGICEEIGMGGNCQVGDDAVDCGSCEWANDGYCDEPNLCPPGSDEADCCAFPQNGVCEEVGMGGECPPGSDPYDCGVCEWTNDNFCDEPNLCPPGSDVDDCCATQENGVCEEVGQGGNCPDHSDDWDCGYCQWTNDGFCDEPGLCPPGSDTDDC